MSYYITFFAKNVKIIKNILQNRHNACEKCPPNMPVRGSKVFSCELLFYCLFGFSCLRSDFRRLGRSFGGFRLASRSLFGAFCGFRRF